MPRAINPQEYQAKRDEILDAAQRLMLSKGYEQMSIQDLIGALSISKGAFYHYFDSKPALLEAMVARMTDEAKRLLEPIIDEPALGALEKLERYFSSVARWKNARRELLVGILRVWYADQNAIVRQKVAAAGGQWLAPLLARVIAQGQHEGVVAADLPPQTAQVVVAIMLSMGDGIAAELLALGPGSSDYEREAALERMRGLVLAYRAAIERLLGAPAGSIVLFDLEILSAWVLEQAAAPAAGAVSSPVG